jgi:hypothetical protein
MMETGAGKVKRMKDWPSPPPSKRPMEDDYSTSGENPLLEDSALLPPKRNRKRDITITFDDKVVEAIDKLRESVEEVKELLERLNNERKLEQLTGKVEL